MFHFKDLCGPGPLGWALFDAASRGSGAVGRWRHGGRHAVTLVVTTTAIKCNTDRCRHEKKKNDRFDFRLRDPEVAAVSVLALSGTFL